jgi:hypothetical protein
MPDATAWAEAEPGRLKKINDFIQTHEHFAEAAKKDRLVEITKFQPPAAAKGNRPAPQNSTSTDSTFVLYMF